MVAVGGSEGTEGSRHHRLSLLERDRWRGKWNEKAGPGLVVGVKKSAQEFARGKEEKRNGR